jgi:hypothetical protein
VRLARVRLPPAGTIHFHYLDAAPSPKVPSPGLSLRFKNDENRGTPRFSSYGTLSIRRYLLTFTTTLQGSGKLPVWSTTTSRKLYWPAGRGLVSH